MHVPRAGIKGGYNKNKYPPLPGIYMQWHAVYNAMVWLLILY